MAEQFVRSVKLMSQTALHGPMNYIASKFMGLKGKFGIDLSGMDKGEESEPFEDNWSFEWWKLFMKLGPLHPKASWGVTRGQITKTAPLVKNYRKVRHTKAQSFFMFYPRIYWLRSRAHGPSCL